jgi:hypothetical protein
MPDIPKPDGPDVNIGPSLLALEWALAGIAAVIITLRWISVVFFLRRVRLADHLMLLALVWHFSSPPPRYRRHDQANTR